MCKSEFPLYQGVKGQYLFYKWKYTETRENISIF